MTPQRTIIHLQTPAIFKVQNLVMFLGERREVGPAASVVKVCLCDPGPRVTCMLAGGVYSWWATHAEQVEG